MKIDRIDVQALSKSHRTDIAMLVDKTDFLQELQTLREKWHINKLYNRKGLFGEPFILDTQNSLFYTDTPEAEAEERLPEFNKDIDLLLNKFKRGKNFRLVIIYALITGIVPEGIYQTSYFDLVTINEPEDENKPENYQYVLVVTPRTEQKDVVKAFREFKQHAKSKIKFHSPRIPLDTPVTKEFTKAVETIEKEKKVYEEEVKKLKTPEEIKKVVTKFITNTSKAREYLMTVGELDINIPEHKELIEQYHLGNIYETADTAKFKKKTDIDRVREWYWIKNKKYFNRETSKPLSYPEVLNEWLNTCPLYKASKEHDLSDVECPKCTFSEKKIRKDKRVKDGGGSYNNVEKALEAYTILLNNS